MKVRLDKIVGLTCAVDKDVYTSELLGDSGLHVEHLHVDSQVGLNDERL